MNILIVGLGSISTKHIMSIRKCVNNPSIYALRSSIISSEIIGVKNVFSLQEFIDIKLDFAIISNPTSEHVKTIGNLLLLKCPLFIEKPLSNNLDLEEIIKKVRDIGNLTYVACNLRFLDSLVFVRDIISKNNMQINEVNSYCGSFMPKWRPNIDFRASYSSIPELGGGVHLDLIHELDYIYWIFGMPLFVQKKLKSDSSLNIRSVDYANYILEYNSFCSSVILNYYRKESKRTLEIVFSDFTWTVDLIENAIYCNSETIFSSNQIIEDTYVAQMSYFINLVQTNKKSSMNTIDDAYNVLKICLEK